MWLIGQRYIEVNFTWLVLREDDDDVDDYDDDDYSYIIQVWTDNAI